MSSNMPFVRVPFNRRGCNGLENPLLGYDLFTGTYDTDGGKWQNPGLSGSFDIKTL
jgi:hypothetical protein